MTRRSRTTMGSPGTWAGAGTILLGAGCAGRPMLPVGAMREVRLPLGHCCEQENQVLAWVAAVLENREGGDADGTPWEQPDLLGALSVIDPQQARTGEHEPHLGDVL